MNSRPASTMPISVIVADVYAAGEAPIEGADRDSLVAAIKRTVIVRRSHSASPQRSRRSCAACQAGRLCGLPRRRQYHAMGLCAAGSIGGRRCAHDLSRSYARLIKLRRTCAAGLNPMSHGGPLLVSHRRCGAGSFHAGGRRRSCLFSRRARSGHSRHVVGVGSTFWCATAASKASSSGSARAFHTSRRSMDCASKRARRFSMSNSRRRQPKRALRAWPSIVAFPAPSAARCG